METDIHQLCTFLLIKKDVEKAHSEITNNYINNFNYSKKVQKNNLG